MLGEQNTLSVAALVVSILCADLAAAMSFGVIGDWGMGGRRNGWTTEMRSVDGFNEACAKLNCNFTLSVGDNIYVGNTAQGLQDSFEDMYTGKMPFFPSVGNHDNVGPQLEYTKHNKRWKFFSPYYTRKLPIDDSGYTVQIFAVNVMDGSLGGGGQLNWLENELKNSDARWKFIFGHYPTTGSGRHKRVGSVGRIYQMMEKYNAQAYWCGHDHIVEMSNVGGRVLGISGGMARGGMMLRGIGGSARRFTLTQPGEYNKYMQDWPGHGFITANLSPNVMTVQVWDQMGLCYEFSVTHDWMSRVLKGDKDIPASRRGEWPPAEEVLKAYKEEEQLPRGPGGGTSYSVDGVEHSTAGSTTPIPTPVPTTLAPGHTAAPTPAPTPIPMTPVPGIEKVTEKPQVPLPVPSYIKYAVSTECVQCKGITANAPFSLFIEGAVVTSSSRLFLTTEEAVGCQNSDKPHLVPGTHLVSPKSNIAVFTASEASRASVCYSIDGGKTFAMLDRADKTLNENYFMVASSDGSTPPPTPVPPQQQGAQPTAAPQVNQGAGPTPSPQAVYQPAPQQSNGMSMTAVVIIGLFSGLGGAVASVYLSNKKSGGNQPGGVRVPASDEVE